MPLIRELLPHLADMIAAGEVVEHFPTALSPRGPRDLKWMERSESAPSQGFALAVKTLAAAWAASRPLDERSPVLCR